MTQVLPDRTVDGVSVGDVVYIAKHEAWFGTIEAFWSDGSINVRPDKSKMTIRVGKGYWLHLPDFYRAPERPTRSRVFDFGVSVLIGIGVGGIVAAIIYQL